MVEWLKKFVICNEIWVTFGLYGKPVAQVSAMYELAKLKIVIADEIVFLNERILWSELDKIFNRDYDKTSNYCFHV